MLGQEGIGGLVHVHFFHTSIPWNTHNYKTSRTPHTHKHRHTFDLIIHLATGLSGSNKTNSRESTAIMNSREGLSHSVVS